MKHGFTILLLMISQLGFGGSISGRVTGGADEPLPGVIVSVQNSTRGTATDDEGRFAIVNLRPGIYTLVFSLVGYRKQVLPDIAVAEDDEKVVSVQMVESLLQTDQIVVTASKREQSLRDVPVSISVVDAAEIAGRNSLTLDDALRYIPGVNLTGPQINIRGSSGYSLGAGSRVLLMLDGVPFIAGDTGELVFEMIPAGQIDRIEVVKGASSALYGSNALGGVVNVITKPVTSVPETFARLYGGVYNKPAFDQWRWSAKTRFLNGQSAGLTRKWGDIGIALFLSRQFDDGYRENDYKRRYNAYLKARTDLSASSALTMNGGLLHQYTGQFLFWRNLDSALIPPRTNQTDNLKSTRYYINGLFNTVLSDDVLLTAKALWAHNVWGFQQMNDNERTESVTDGMRAEIGIRLTANDSHSITTGIEGNLDMIRGEMFATRTIGGVAVYVQDEVMMGGGLTLTLGARFDRQTVGLAGEGMQLNPKVAMTFMPWDGTTFRASAGRGFRVPSIAEAYIAAGGGVVRGIPNTDLKPERSLSLEAGVSHALGESGLLDATVFRSDYDNMIEPGLIVSGQNLNVQWRNVTSARVQGFETSFKAALFAGGVQTSLGYTYVYPEDRTKNDLLKYRPRHLLYTNIHGTLGWFSAGGDFRFVSRVDRIDDELVDTGIVPDGDERTDIVVADFRVGATIAMEAFELAVLLNVRNAFQHNYVELIGNIMPPRTYVLSLEARL